VGGTAQALLIGVVAGVAANVLMAIVVPPEAAARIRTWLMSPLAAPRVVFLGLAIAVAALALGRV
jgi:hypothetical protein